MSTRAAHPDPGPGRTPDRTRFLHACAAQGPFRPACQGACNRNSLACLDSRPGPAPACLALFPNVSPAPGPFHLPPGTPCNSLYCLAFCGWAGPPRARDATCFPQLSSSQRADHAPPSRSPEPVLPCLKNRLGPPSRAASGTGSGLPSLPSIRRVPGLAGGCWPRGGASPGCPGRKAMRRAQGRVSEPAVVTKPRHRQIGHSMLRVRHSGRAGHLPDRPQTPRRQDHVHIQQDRSRRRRSIRNPRPGAGSHLKSRP